MEDFINVAKLNFKVIELEERICKCKEKNKTELERNTMLNEHIQGLVEKISEGYATENDLNDKVRELELKIDSMTSENEFYKEYGVRVNYVPVTQFNELYWGDNYPALKALFDYLQKIRALDCNWSYFSYLMCVDNFEPINLKTDIFRKSDYGYLFYSLKSFFKIEYNRTPANFNNWLKSKLFIDDKTVDDSTIKQYFRGYNKGKLPPSIKGSEIDNLVLKISGRYH